MLPRPTAQSLHSWGEAGTAWRSGGGSDTSPWDQGEESVERPCTGLQVSGRPSTCGTSRAQPGLKNFLDGSSWAPSGVPFIPPPTLAPIPPSGAQGGADT